MTANALGKLMCGLSKVIESDALKKSIPEMYTSAAARWCELRPLMRFGLTETHGAYTGIIMLGDFVQRSSLARELEHLDAGRLVTYRQKEVGSGYGLQEGARLELRFVE